MSDKEEARQAELSASAEEGREKLIDRLFSFFVGGPKEHDHGITEEGRQASAGKKGRRKGRRRYSPPGPPPGGDFGGGGWFGGGGFGGGDCGGGGGGGGC